MIEPGGVVLEASTVQVLSDDRGWHGTIYPVRYLLRLINLDIASVCVDDEHLAEHIAGIAACRLHQRDSPVRVITIVEFEGGVNQPTIGIPAQIDMAQQVLVQQRTRQIRNGASGLDLVGE